MGNQKLIEEAIEDAYKAAIGNAFGFLMTEITVEPTKNKKEEAEKAFALAIKIATETYQKAKELAKCS